MRCSPAEIAPSAGKPPRPRACVWSKSSTPTSPGPANKPRPSAAPGARLSCRADYSINLFDKLFVKFYRFLHRIFWPAIFRIFFSGRPRGIRAVGLDQRVEINIRVVRAEVILDIRVDDRVF